MLEFHLRLSTGTIKVTGATQKDLFRALGRAQEVFGESSCGKCGSEKIVFSCRKIDDNEFFEVTCTKCQAYLHIGQSKKDVGALFPCRKLLPNGKPHFKEGKYDDQHRGWTTYRGGREDGDGNEEDLFRKR